MKIDPATRSLWIRMDAYLLQVRSGANEIRAGADKALKLLAEIENFTPPHAQTPGQMALTFIEEIEEEANGVS